MDGNIDETEKVEERDLNFLNKYQNIVVVVLAFVVALYFFLNSFVTIDTKIAGNLGTVGDFFGGILNPVFALLSLFALLATIRFQSIELRLTRKELELTRGETEKSNEIFTEQKKSMEFQNISIKQQNFETTFFNMMKQHDSIVESIRLNPGESISTISIIKSMIEEDTVLFKNSKPFALNGIAFFSYYTKRLKYILGNFGLSEKNTLIKKEQHSESIVFDDNVRTNAIYLHLHHLIVNYIGRYFRNIYQILKYIKNSEGATLDQKFYSSIYRAQFSTSELVALYFNCISDVGSEKFLPLLIEYEFLEHLPYDEIDFNYAAQNMLELDIKFIIEETKKLNPSYSASKIFGKNKKWKEVIDKIVEESKKE